METLVVIVVGLIILGAILSWIGRTWLTLIISYLVVGSVGAVILYLGFETYRLASGLSTLAEQLESPPLIVIVKAGLEPIALVLGAFDEDERLMLISIVTIVTTIAITLPFVTFANSVYAAMTAGEATSAVKSMQGEVSKRLDDLQGEHKRTAEAILTELRSLQQSYRETTSTIREELRGGDRKKQA